MAVVEENALGAHCCGVFNAVTYDLFIRMLRAVRTERSLRSGHFAALRIGNKLQNCEILGKSGSAGRHSDVAASRAGNLRVLDDVVETELATGVSAAEETRTVRGVVEEVGANWALHGSYY